MENAIKIMLVESDCNYGETIVHFLNSKGYQTSLYSNAAEAIKQFKERQFDLVISEVSLSGADGFDMIRELKKFNEELPLIFFTNRSSRADMSKGFAIGADDYIVKPVTLEELSNRVKAVCRRTILIPQNTYVYKLSSYSFDIIRHVLIREGKEIKVSGREMELLHMFCEHKNEIVERSYALKRIWKNDNYFNARNMDVYITKLRKMFKDDPNIQFVNIHGIGYKLIVKE